MPNYVSPEQIEGLFGNTEQQKMRMRRFVQSFLNPDRNPIWLQRTPRPDEVASMDEYCRAGVIADIIKYNNADIRIGEPYIHERDALDVKTDRVIYPGSELSFARFVMSGEVSLSPLD